MVSVLCRRFGQQFNAELAAGARWVATPMRLAELMDSGGHGLEQAFGLNIDLVHNPFDVAIFDLAERHWKRIALRLLFAYPELCTFALVAVTARQSSSLRATPRSRIP